MNVQVVSQPLKSMRGEDREETVLLQEMADAARGFISAQRWCAKLTELRWGGGIGGVVAVFLAGLKPQPGSGADDRVWLVVGDVPSAYIDVDARATTTAGVLAVYCEQLRAWIAAVRTGRPLDRVYPFAAAPTAATAALLETRVAAIERDVIPMLTTPRA